MEGQQSIVTATAILCHFFHVHSGHPGVLHIPDLPGAHQEPCSADLQDCDSGLCPMPCCTQQILPGAPSSPSQVSAQNTSAPARDEWQRSVTWHSTLDSYSRRQTLGSCQHKHLPGGISSPQDRKEEKIRWRVPCSTSGVLVLPGMLLPAARYYFTKKSVLVSCWGPPMCIPAGCPSLTAAGTALASSHALVLVCLFSWPCTLKLQ